MSLQDLPLVRDRAPRLICRGLPSRTGAFTVPVTHTLADAPTPDEFAQLETTLGALAPGHDLVEFYRRYNGARLFVGPETPTMAEHAAQYACGSIYLAAINEWGPMRAELEDWFFDGPVAEFAECDFGWDDIVPFARRNWSPDQWFVIINGPQKGKIGFYGHDGEGLESPLFDDLRALLAWLREEPPEAFGGVIRFTPDCAIETVPSGIAELYPESYMCDS